MTESAPAGRRPHGILLVDKPSGPTSHDIVAVVRRGTGQRRVGHAGTLDPLATGLLVLCLGTATRLSEFLAGKDKRYQARVRLGQATTTYDAQGEVTAENGALPSQGEVEQALGAFRGPQQQVPPQFSAIKRGGQKAYEAARRGETLELAPRPITIYSLALTGWEPPDALLDVHCSAGTYIRSLAHDLGQRLGCGAHVAALRRTQSGTLSVAAALPLDALQHSFAAGDWERHLMPAGEALADWPAVEVSTQEALRIRQGQGVPLVGPNAEYARAFDPAGEFFAILRADLGARMWRPHKVFVER